MLATKRKHMNTSIKVLLLISSIFFVNVSSKFLERTPLSVDAQEEHDLFPYVGMSMTYDIVVSTGGLAPDSGTLEIEYLTMLDETRIFGEFRVLVFFPSFYNETTGGSEDLLTRHLDVNTDNTYIIWLFWDYFFNRTEQIVPTPMWIFPNDCKINATIGVQNYTSTTTRSEAITIMDKSYEVFVFKTFGSRFNMTLLYGYAMHGTSERYGLLFYMAGYFIEPVTERRMAVFFKLRETNADLFPLDVINKNTIVAISISFYGVIIIGATTYRIKKRRELVGGEV